MGYQCDQCGSHYSPPRHCVPCGARDSMVNTEWENAAKLRDLEDERDRYRKELEQQDELWELATDLLVDGADISFLDLWDPRERIRKALEGDDGD